jgi:hypothetical protein
MLDRIDYNVERMEMLATNAAYCEFFIVSQGRKGKKSRIHRSLVVDTLTRTQSSRNAKRTAQ